MLKIEKFVHKLKCIFGNFLIKKLDIDFDSWNLFALFLDCFVSNLWAFSSNNLSGMRFLLFSITIKTLRFSFVIKSVILLILSVPYLHN